jgi:uncharacterized protein (TIGR02266 family)
MKGQGLSSKAKCKVNPADSRNQYRAPTKIVLSYRTIDQFFSDIATNISLGGIFIKTPRPLAVGTVLRISFAIPQFESYVEANGVVIHTGTPDAMGMGIKFSEIDNRALRAIDEMIKHDLCADDKKAGKAALKAKAAVKKAIAKTHAAKKAPVKKAPAKKPAKMAAKKSGKKKAR